jgi:hypothetical protein
LTSALLVGCGADQAVDLGEAREAESVPESVSASEEGAGAHRLPSPADASEGSPAATDSGSDELESTGPESVETTVAGDEGASDPDLPPLDDEALAEMERTLDEIDQLLTDLELDLAAD